MTYDFNDFHREHGTDGLREEFDRMSAVAVPPQYSSTTDPTPPIRPVIFRASELMKQVFPAVRYAVPGYVPEGCTILAGRPKLGKSWLCLDMAIAVASGGDCMGNVRCESGSVLYLALEDNLRRLQNRMRKLLFAGSIAPNGLQIATEWPRADAGGIEAIADWIDKTPDARLVIVDVLAMFRSARRQNEAQYDADYAAIKGLQKLAGNTGVAIVVVHHTRKGSGSDSGDPFEKISGTLGLSGGADTAIVLDCDHNGTTIYGRGRDIEEFERAVIFDKTLCQWTVQGDACDVRRTDERSAILGTLMDADYEMSPGDIADVTRMPSPNVRQLLVSMVKAGEVLKIRRGRYVHPSRHDLITPSTPDHNDHKITNGGEEAEDDG